MNQLATSNAPWYQAIAESKRQFIQIAKSEGSDINYQKEALFAVQAIQNNEYLMNIANNNPQSLQDAVINIASIGLSLNPAEKLAYLVPRGDKACLDISYIGLIKLATDTGSIIWTKPVLVFENDTYESQGVNLLPMHKYNPFDNDRGEIIGGYSVAKLHNGDMIVDEQKEEYFLKCKNVAKAKNVWNDWPEPMRLKTLIKTGSKFWPKSKRLDKAIQIINEHEGADFSRTNNAQASELQPPRQLQQPAANQAQAAQPIDNTEQPIQQSTGPTLDDGQSHMVRITMEKYGVDEGVLFAAFSIDKIEDIPLASINNVLTWIRNYKE